MSYEGERWIPPGEPVLTERLPPPVSAIGWRAWLRENLFNGWRSSVLNGKPPSFSTPCSTALA